MTSRERALKAIDHIETDRPPVYTTLTPEVGALLEKRLGLPVTTPYDSMLSVRISHTEALLKMGNDFVGVAACAPKCCPTHLIEEENAITNEWGMRFRPEGLFASHPLSDIQSVKDLDEYPWPDPYAEGRFDVAAETIKKYRDNYCIVGNLECCLFETAWYLVGFEKMLTDLATGDKNVPELLDRILEINIKTGVKLVEMGVDVLWAGDDYGTQDGLMVSPQMWREIFKPRIKKLFDAFRQVNPDIKLAWHSCGSIAPIIPDFIDIGLDILNPIQPMAKGMDAKFLKQTYGDQLVFFGGIDIQRLFPFGTPQEVKQVVTEQIDILGTGGGYILAPAHNVQLDSPLDNLFAMYEAVQAYGASSHKECSC